MSKTAEEKLLIDAENCRLESIPRENVIIAIKYAIEDIKKEREAYAKQKVLEALEEEIPKAFNIAVNNVQHNSDEVWRSIGNEEYEPEYKTMDEDEYFTKEVKPKYEGREEV